MVSSSFSFRFVLDFNRSFYIVVIGRFLLYLECLGYFSTVVTKHTYNSSLRKRFIFDSLL